MEDALPRRGLAFRGPLKGSKISLRIQATNEGESMKITHAQKLELYEKGFVQIPSAVPGVMVDAAVKAINHSFGKGIDPAKMIDFQARSFCPELRQAPVITDLYNQTPVKALAESMIGVGKVNPVTAGQIAVRFPLLDDPPPALSPHLDGRYSPHNGVPKGELHSFTLLVGIALSEVTTDYAGNLVAWPGTHRLFEQYFRENGTEFMTRDDSVETLPLEMPQPQMMTARPGDAFFVHYQVAHAAAPNISPHPRYAIYFRLRHVDHKAQLFETLTDIWMEWESMREIAAQRGAPIPAS